MGGLRGWHSSVKQLCLSAGQQGITPWSPKKASSKLPCFPSSTKQTLTSEQGIVLVVILQEASKLLPPLYLRTGTFLAFRLISHFFFSCSACPTSGQWERSGLTPGPLFLSAHSNLLAQEGIASSPSSSPQTWRELTITEPLVCLGAAFPLTFVLIRPFLN